MKNESFRGLPPAMRRVARAGMPAIALLLAATLAGCSGHPGNTAPDASATPHDVTLSKAQREHIRLYTVATSSYRRTIDTTGVVDFDNDQATSVLAPFSGPVTRLLVTAGEQVKKGQALAVVASPDFASAIGDYRKALDTARTARKLATQDKDLVEHQGVSLREAEQAQTDAANAEADRDAALQALKALHVDPKDIEAVREGRPIARIEGVIRAPIAGTVAERPITVGQLLQAGSTPCFTIADLSRVWVQARVFGSDLAAVDVGAPAEVEVDGSPEPLAGKVTNLSAEVAPDTRSVLARVQVDNPGGLLKKQMYVRVAIRSGKTTHGLLVPVAAVLRDDDNLPFVYVAQADGSFARRHVTLGYRDGDRYVIAAGLRAGDRVVVDGGIFVRFMQDQ
jgi:cobalt-zinc-cadmium efflux system membrane fusion protein